MKRLQLGVLVVALACAHSVQAQALPGTKLLTEKIDFAASMVDGIDAWLDKQLAASVQKRAVHWKQDFSAPEQYEKSVAANRARFQRIIGVVDERLPPKMEYVRAVGETVDVAATRPYVVHAVRWSVLPGVDGAGLLLEPRNGKPIACVVALPDADVTPEMFVGISKEKLAEPQQLARLLAENGCRVLVPTLIDRQDRWSNNPSIGRFTNQPHREFVYRMAYEMGRHIIGYEVQKVLAAVDYWTQQEPKGLPIAVVGHGEGGLIALYSAALDPRIQTAVVAGYFGPREGIADEPIYRNVWKLLHEFGDAEIAGLVAPRQLIIVPCEVPSVDGPPAPQPKKAGAAPGKIGTVPRALVEGEFARARRLSYDRLGVAKNTGMVLAELTSDQKAGYWLNAFCVAISAQPQGAAGDVAVQRHIDAEVRQQQQFRQLVDFTQKLLPEAKLKRDKFFWSRLDNSSVEAMQKSAAPLREYFAEEIIGKLPASTAPLNPRTRLAYETPKWKGYEVVLDLYEDVICYGILLVPNDLRPGEKRPVVVCQHGLEGRPQDVVEPKTKTKYYNSFGAQLADRGFVVFAPQNPYIFENKFRQIVRKANPLGLTLYSFIVQQHERILDWLVTLPYVDAGRIAYYGLSYGGKVAMRIPVLVGRYYLSICSGDFNEWIWKNITLDWGGSYMFTREYEMFEFDLGNTFNYAEMAALIAPRPFMVERGHRDGVGLDEHVGFEYAKVRRFYAELGIGERTEIEFFRGFHEINGKGTFQFLSRFLPF